MGHSEGFPADVTVQQGRPAPFVQLPFQLLSDPDIDAFGIAVYAGLAKLIASGHTTPSRREIAREAGCGSRTVADRCAILERAGWLEKIENNGSRNLYSLNAYLPPVQEMHGSRAGDARVHGSSPSNGAPSSSPPHPLNNTPSLTSPTSKHTSNRDFEESTLELDLETQPPPIETLWSIWIEELGGDPPFPTLTAKRKKKLNALWAEHLSGQENPLRVFREMLKALQASEFHMKTRAYQMPESFLRNEENRERWFLAGVNGEGRERGWFGGIATRSQLREWGEL